MAAAKRKSGRSARGKFELAKSKIDNQEFGAAQEILLQLSQAPEANGEIWHKLGTVNYFMGDYPGALVAFEKSIEKAPANADYKNDLAGVLLALKRYPEAAALYQRVIELAPNYLGAKYNLATCLLEQGNYAEAIPQLIEVFNKDSNFLEAAFNVGIAYRNLGEFHAALSWLNKAMNLKAERPRIHLEIARCFRKLKNYGEASGHYQASKLYSHDFTVLEEYAEVVYLDGKSDIAISLLEDALEASSPGAQSLRILLADIYVNTGQLTAAGRTLSPLLDDRNHDLFPSAANLGVRINLEKEYNLIGKLYERLQENVDDNIGQTKIYFALAQCEHNAGNHQRSAAHLHAANERQYRLNQSYDRARHEQLIAEIEDVFTDSNELEGETTAQATIQPIFIVGMPRSGTTLIEQILAAHKDISGAGELGYFAHATIGMQSILSLDQAYPYTMRELERRHITALRNPYIDLLKKHQRSGMHVVDKFPENFLHIGLIRMLFPQSTIIHASRDARDIALSIYFQNFAEGNKYAWRLTDIAHYYVQYQRVMRFWQRRFGNSIIEIKYENLVGNIKDEIRPVLTGLALEWDEACLNYYQAASDVRTASNWQVRQPIYNKSIGRWQYYPELIQEFIDEVAVQRARFGLDSS